MECDLSTAPIIVVGLASQENRWQEVDAMRRDKGFGLLIARKFNEERSYPNCRRAYIQVLESLTEFPAIILENDARPTSEFVQKFEVPDDAGVIYLGVYRYGAIRKNGRLVRQHAETEPTDHPEYARALNMLTTHAVLFMTPEARDEMAGIMMADDSELPHDLAICEAQPGHQFILRRKPLFYQKYTHDDSTLVELKGEKWSRIKPFR